MKRILLTIGILISFQSFGQIRQTDLLSEYKFASGNLQDAAGSQALTQTGSAMTVVSDRAGGASRAISLNGDYLQRTNNTAGDYDLSVSFWIKTSTDDANKRVIIDQTERVDDGEGVSYTGWYAYLQNGAVGVAGNYQWARQQVNIVSGTVWEQTGFKGYLSTSGTTNIADGNWHHVTITIFTNGGARSGTQVKATYKVYIDNVMEASNDQIYVGPDHPWTKMKRFVNLSVPITIGNDRNGASTNVYQDEIDDVRFYGANMSASDVTNLYNEAGCANSNGVTAKTKDITIELDANGNATIEAADINDGSFADCDDPFTMSIDKSSFTCADLGFNVVTLTATETFGAQTVDTETATVTVIYVPEVIAQDLTVQLDASGNATITPAQVDNGSATTGLCGAALSLSLDKSAFTCADIGQNVVTLTSSDGNGNEGTATATITVEDNLAPTATTQNITVNVDANTGFVTINPAMVDNGSTDNCGTGSLVMSLSKTKFRCEDTGDNVVTLTVEDAQGNSSTADATVTVTSEVNNETITSADASFCVDGSTGATISTGSSVVGFNYTLRKSEDNSIVDGPIAGTGNSLDFSTGNISATTKYNIYAEKALATTQSALDFDGVNDYVSLGTHNKGVSTAITVAAWIKTSTTGAAQFFTNKYDGANGFHLFMNDQGKAGIAGRDGGAGGYKQSGYSTIAVNDGQWHYIVGTIDITTGVWSVYVDGVLESSTTHAVGNTLAAGSADWTMGVNGSVYFAGQMDQFTIWNVALDAATIESNMNACLTGSETDIVGHYIFEDGSGTLLTDQSSTAINAALTNMDGATDWIQVVSPSCGEKACDYEMSTEITVGDDTAPTAVAQDLSIQIDAGTGSVAITADMVDNGSSDNCTTSLIKSISQTEFTCEDVGQKQITLTIEDESGNTSTANATITVTSPINDETVTTANTTFCPDGSIATISTGSSVVGVDYYLRDSEDDSIIDGPIAGTGSGLDFSTGNISSTTTFNVFAELAPPTHSALVFDGVNDKVTTAYMPPATNGLTVELWMKPSKTTYSRVISSYRGSSGVPSGEIALDTYGDGTNNGKGLRFWVSGANDNQFYYGIPDVLTLDVWNHVAAIFDNGVIRFYVDGALVGTSTPASFTSLPQSTSAVAIGEDRIQGGAAEYFQGSIDEVRIWSIARTQAEIVDNKSKCLTGSETGLDLYYNFDENTGAVTSDLAGNNDGTLTNGTDWAQSDVTITCGSTCGVEMSTELTLGDEVAPTAAAQDITIQLDAAGNASITTADINNGSTDNCTADASLNIGLDKSDFTCADVGANTVTLTVEDAGGNTSTATATVTVEDNAAPVVAIQNITVQLDASGNAAVSAADVDNGTADNCTDAGQLTLSLSTTAFDCSDIGVNTVTFTATDAAGNEATASVDITVQDTMIPEVVTKDITLALDASGSASITPEDIKTSWSDNCTTEASLTTSLDISSFSCSDTGANTVTLTVTDGNGNQATATATVTVEDDIAPTAVAQNLTVNLFGSTSATITAAEVDNGSSDNCTAAGDLIMSLNKSTFTDAEIGVHTIMLTVQDESGNSGFASAEITVLDKLTQDITFSGVPTAPKYGDAAFTITASSETNVTLSKISGPVSLNGMEVTITGAGDVELELVAATDATYAEARESISFSVAKVPLTITADDQSATYGTTPEFTMSYSGFVNGDTHASLTSPTVNIVADNSASRSKAPDNSNYGAGNYIIELVGGASDDYNLTLVDGSFVVNKAELTITADNKSINYGASTPLFTVSYTGFMNGETESALDETPSVTRQASASRASELLNAGTYTLVVSGAASENYSFNYVNGELSVAKLPLTVTAEDVSMVYGDAFPELPFAYSGFLAGEDASVLDQVPSAFVDADEITAGTHTIEFSEGLAMNYEFTYVNATLTVAKAQATVTLSDLDQNYTGTAIMPTVTTDPAGLNYSVTYDGSTDAPVDEGTYAVVVTIDDLNHVGSASGTMTITYVLDAEPQMAAVNIYPVPSRGTLNIELDHSQKGSAMLFNMEGRVVAEFELDYGRNTKDLSRLKSGIYSLSIMDESNAMIKRQKIILQN